jgi:hypothetical protein
MQVSGIRIFATQMNCSSGTTYCYSALSKNGRFVAYNYHRSAAPNDQMAA